jgi:hypothetical protein
MHGLQNFKNPDYCLWFNSFASTVGKFLKVLFVHIPVVIVQAMGLGWRSD